MAVNIKLDKDDLRRKLECPVCLDILDRPRILTNCGHSLCTNCIILIVSKNSFNDKMSIECPTCLIKSEITGISSLKINYSLLDIIESMDNDENITSNSCPEKSYLSKNPKILKKSASVPDLRYQFQEIIPENIINENIINENIYDDNQLYLENNEEKKSSREYCPTNIFLNMFKSCNDR